MARGYIQESNLSESASRDADKRILNNLGGGNISDDIALFANNLRNYSTLSASSYIVDGNKIKITSNVVLPFANNTAVLYDNKLYTVINSNTTDSFQLKDAADVVFVPTAPLDITRKDAITATSIQNLNPERILTKISRNDSTADGWYDIYNRYTTNEEITAIEEYIEVFQYKLNNTLMADRANTVHSDFKLNGTVVITNLTENGDPVTGQTVIGENDPGLFITNGTTKVRAFSDSSNPWTADVGTGVTATTASTTTIKNLVVTNLSINGISPTVDAGIVSSFTHSYPVEINGEIYYLLCKIT